MFRKVLLSAIVAVGCVTPFVAAPQVSAESYHHHHHYHVFYRACCDEPWVCHGSYEHFERARHAAHHLRERGFEVQIR